MNQGSIESDSKGMIKENLPEPCTIVICGAAGDLSHRELFPALFSLFTSGLLPGNFSIIGFEALLFTDESFREEVKKALKKGSSYSDENWEKFSTRLFYVQGDFNDDINASYKILGDKIKVAQKEFNIKDNILFHLAVPPRFYGIIIKRIYESGIAKSDGGWRRIIIEKPFGDDENSAKELDNEIHKYFDESQIFRVDHFLGKETVQNMLVFRFANAGFEPIWNRNYIDNVQIVVAEDIGIGTRGAFYENVGVIKDMVQNHLLQLLCMVAMEPPVNYDANSLRVQTTQVLESVCPIKDIDSDVVLGQYAAGEINNEKVPGYRDEKNVDNNSMTPTYIALKLHLDNWRWAGVPFYLQTGKRLKQQLTEITIKFKPTPHLMFPAHILKGKRRNTLTFRLQPNEGIIYTFIAKQPGTELNLSRVNLDFDYASAFGIEKLPSAYQWLIYDAMQGDQTLFPKAEWIYKAWNIVDPIIAKWKSKQWEKFPNYSADSWGPEEAINLPGKDGRKWNIL